MKDLFWGNVSKAIFKKELRSYFNNPLGHVFLVIFLFALAQVGFEPGRGSFYLNRQASLQPFFQYIPWLFLFLIPAISMRLWAEERRSGTIELLLTLPVRIPQAIWGKFLAGMVFLKIALFLTFPLILTLEYLGSPDYGEVILSYLGAFLVGGSYLAVGLFFSALTKNQVISFILSLCACYVLLMSGSPPLLNFLSNIGLPNFLLDLFEGLSIMNHYEALQRGVMRLGDILYFLILIVGWLWAAHLVLDEQKSN